MLTHINNMLTHINVICLHISGKFRTFVVEKERDTNPILTKNQGGQNYDKETMATRKSGTHQCNT